MNMGVEQRHIIVMFNHAELEIRVYFRAGLFSQIAVAALKVRKWS